MKSRTSTKLASALLLFGALVMAAGVDAKRPVKPPPEPVNTGADCAEHDSFFPAFVYEFTGELFLSNAAGDCRISIYSTDWAIAGAPSAISYRYFSDSGTGMIAWSEQQRNFKTGWERSRIYLLTFQVVDKVLQGPLPMTPELLLEAPLSMSEGGNMFHPEIAPDGTRALLAGFEKYDGIETGFIEEIDIASGDRARVYQAQENWTTYHPLYGLEDRPGGPRIYFLQVDYPLRQLVYIEQDEEGQWSDPVEIASRSDGRLIVGAIGLWDYDGDGFAQEVIAQPRDLADYHAVEILDVDACVEGSGDCMVIGADGSDGIVIESALPQAMSFSSFGETPPDLLYLFDAPGSNVGFGIREFDLESRTVRTVYEGVRDPKRTYYGVDSGD